MGAITKKSSSIGLTYASVLAHIQSLVKAFIDDTSKVG